MRIIHLISSVLLACTLSSCQNETEPISYGQDDCHFCSMRIMDPRFGSEAITDKGRVYKFDSAECLLRYLNESDEPHSHIVVTDYSNPHLFIPAAEATYVISEHMPSPMGGDLNAFADEASARDALDGRSGTVVDWKGLTQIYAE